MKTDSTAAGSAANDDARQDSISGVIEAYVFADTAYRDVVRAVGEYHGHEWDALIAAKHALFSCECRNEADRRMKVAFALEDARVFDAIRNDHIDGSPALYRFLASLF